MGVVDLEHKAGQHRGGGNASKSHKTHEPWAWHGAHGKQLVATAPEGALTSMKDPCLHDIA